MMLLHFLVYLSPVSCIHVENSLGSCLRKYVVKVKVQSQTISCATVSVLISITAIAELKEVNTQCRAHKVVDTQ